MKVHKRDKSKNLGIVPAEVNKQLCHGCVKCCMHLNHEIDPPESNEDCDYIIWFLLHENISIWVDDENVWYIEFKTPCKELKNDLCGIYDRRPQVCREYLQDKCLNSNLDEDISFNTPEEFLAYLNKNKIYDYSGYYQNKQKLFPWTRRMMILSWLGGMVIILFGFWWLRRS